MRNGNFELFVFLTYAMCLVYVFSEYVPVDNYLIDSGSLNNSLVSGRLFLSDTNDSYTISTQNTIFIKTNSTSLSSTYGQSLYQTARVLNEATLFTFPIKKPGRHWIRLYLSPFNSGDYNLSAAKFSVSAQNFTLFNDFQVQNGSVVKEYSINITSDKLVITFTPSFESFAFLNALEVVSVPDELIPVHARVVGSLNSHQNLYSRALETVARVNMGNETVLPQNDTLWRHWVSDDLSLKHSNLVMYWSNISAVNYTNESASEDIAPPSVYGTVTMLNSTIDPNINANVTWYFDVDPGFEYLVRFHFCDIVSHFSSPSPLFLNVYMHSEIVYRNLNLGNETSHVFGAPYYLDAVVKISNHRTLNISVGPSTVDNNYPNAILNGLEVMKINNAKDSLAVLDSDIESSKQKSNLKIWVIVGVLCIALVLVLVLVFFLMFRKRKNLAHVGNSHTEDQYAVHDGKNSNQTAIISNSNIGYRFPFVAIQEATDNFSESLAIGVGGFGKVYKGVLKDGLKVAVKRGVPQSPQGLAEFETEIEMLSQFRHRHLVSLIGYCDEKNEMIIIYEYMENGALKNLLYNSDLPSLSWKQILEICIGSARGLHYLHTGTVNAIIHRDVKSANILLDENLMAKVADFGLSKTGPSLDETHVSTAVKGSFGYLDPEYLTRQQLTEKSDVYSFGVVLLEVICGRPVIDPSRPREMVNLVEWAMKWQRRGELDLIIDARLMGEIKSNSLSKFGETAEKCLAACGADRPSMGDVLWNLECALQLQGDEARTSHPQSNIANNLDASVSIADFSMGSVNDLDGVSMSRVFSEMVKADMQ